MQPHTIHCATTADCGCPTVLESDYKTVPSKLPIRAHVMEWAYVSTLVASECRGKTGCGNLAALVRAMAGSQQVPSSRGGLQPIVFLNTSKSCTLPTTQAHNTSTGVRSGLTQTRTLKEKEARNSVGRSCKARHFAWLLIGSCLAENLLEPV